MRPRKQVQASLMRMPSSSVRARNALLSIAALALGCCASASQTLAPPSEPAPPAPVASGPTYDVHEWGLVRGTAADLAVLSGPHANEIAVPVAKPVLYFHRVGEGPLAIDVRVHIDGGRIVEHWPEAIDPGEPGSDIGWQVQLGNEACAGHHYPSEFTESPCSRLMRVGDGCEAAQLRLVETTDSACLTWQRASDQPATPWNNLFYRAELNRDPHLPLELRSRTAGVLQATLHGADAIVGSVIRLHQGNGEPGAGSCASVVPGPASNTTVDLPAPTESMATAAEALDASLRAAGLTADETAAFRRAWDTTLFGDFTRGCDSPATLGAITATPTAGLFLPRATRSVLYVLPEATADSLATLRFTPAPRAVRRVIVAWVDEPAP